MTKRVSAVGLCVGVLSAYFLVTGKSEGRTAKSEAIRPAAVSQPAPHSHPAPPATARNGTEAQPDSTPKPMGWQSLMAKYLSTRPELAEDPEFIEEYAKFSRCESWRKVHENEFKYKDFLSETKELYLQEVRKPTPTLFSLRTGGTFGEYDFIAEQFPFRPLKDGAGFVFEMNMNYLGVGGLVSNCTPQNGKWPADIVVRITNPWILDGLPMAKDDAQRLVARNPAKYERDLGVNLVLRIATVGDAKASGKRQLGRIAAEAEAEIVAATVDDGGKAGPKTIFTLDDDYARKRATAQEGLKKAEAAVTEGSVDATADAVNKYVDKFSKLPAGQLPELDAADPLLRMAVNVGTTGFGNEKSTFGVTLEENSSFTVSGSLVPIRLANPTDFRDVPIPSDVLDFAKGKYPHIDIALFLKPTGYVADEYLGRYMMAHIAKVGVTLRASGDQAKKGWVIEAKDQAKPFNPLADQRTAADFELLGISGGMSPDDVQKAVEKELGHKLVFDEKAMTLTSPASECGFTFDSNKTPPGRKCFKADFRVKEKGLLAAKLGLARAAYRQAIYKKANADLAALLVEKYGPPVYEARGNDDFIGSFIGGQGTVRTFKEWGKRLTKDRKGMMTTKMEVPVHTLEAEIAAELKGDMVHLTMTLTDELMANEINAANAAADAAKKAEEERKTKADVKL